VAGLAGLPVLLVAVVGPPGAHDLAWWRWAATGVRYQGLPLDLLLAALGLMAWTLWGYATLATGLRVVAVLAAQWGLGGSARLLAVTNLVTAPPLRSLVDAAVGVSLLASAAHAVASPAALADPPAVIQSLEASAAYGRAAAPADLAPATPAVTDQPGVVESEGSAEATETATPVDQAHPNARHRGRVYTVVEGDSLWRIAERELGDGHQWREIFVANQGRRMGDGQFLTNAELILPGWQLLLPSAAAAGSQPPTDPTLIHPPPPAAPPPPSSAAPEGPPPTATGQPAPPINDRRELPTTTPAPDDATPDGHRHIVELPSGSMVGLSVAVAIAAALAIATRRRRRHRRPLWPPASPARRPSDPATISTAWLLALAAANATQPHDTDGALDPAPKPQLGAATRDPCDPTPARVVVGVHGGQEVQVDLAGHGAIGILGPDGGGLARAAVIGLLAAGGPDAVEVVLVGNQLIPDALGFPGLRRAASLDGALHLVETELVQRARLLEAEEAPDFPTHRRDHPDDPLPALVLAADQVSLEQAGRLAAILAQGPRLGVGALLAGCSVDGGAQLRLDDRGRIQTTTPWKLSDRQLSGTRACSLTPAEATELLRVLAQARSDDPAAGESDQPAAAPSPPPDPPPDAPVEAPPPPLEEPARTQVLVQVRLLGPYTIRTSVAGEVRSGLRASARELLAYYLVHPDGATLEQAVEAMWPDTELGRERERFWTALGNLRSILRKATGVSELKAIQRDGLRYRVDPELFAADLWRFQAAVATARRADLDSAVVAALAEAGDAYSGPLLDGAPYAWVEIVREDLRRQAVDALAHLAELRQAVSDRQGALAALELAIAADPVAEELYRRLMRLQAELGRPDGVRRSYRLLARRLAELDVDPDPETEQLVAELLRRPGA
jgi:DNA-binding SARP family transcriptional activator